MCLPDCLLQVRQTSQLCFKFLWKGVSVEKGEREREKENSWESPEGQSAFGSCNKARTQQLDPAVNSSFNIYPLTLRGGISFTLPVSLSMFVSLYSFTLSVQTSYLSPLPFPTLLCPFCDPISPLHFPLFPSGVVTCTSEQVRAAHLLPGDTQASLECWEHLVGGWLVGLTQTRPRIIQFDDARKR